MKNNTKNLILKTYIKNYNEDVYKNLRHLFSKIELKISELNTCEVDKLLIAKKNNVKLDDKLFNIKKDLYRLSDILNSILDADAKGLYNKNENFGV